MKNNYYGTLILEGSRAEATVGCMRQDGLLPQETLGEKLGSALGLSPRYGVEVRPSGSVSVDRNHKTLVREFDEIGSTGEMVAGFDAEGQSFATTPDVTARGPVADEMRKKALACALKGSGVAP